MGANAIGPNDDARDRDATRIGRAAFRGTLVALRATVIAAIATILGRIVIPHADLRAIFGTVFVVLLASAAMATFFRTRRDPDRAQ